MAQSSAGSPPPEKDPAIKATPGESSFAESRNPDETFELASPSGADSLSSGCFEHAPGEPGVPKAFGRYEVVKVLGSGGFGTVYLGHDRQLDRPVAIKSHRADRAISQEILNEFLHEARRLAKLRHPGIVAVHDFGADGGHVFIISDYVEGITLSDRLESQPITWQESVRIIAALADALAHAHALRIVHRDIKPANIILTPDGKPVLVDFGLGLDDSELDGGKRGLIAGTPAYMSPEQASGRGHRIDGRTDIYALGVVLYELLTGRVPFCAAIISELLRQVREDDPQPPRQLVPQVPRALESICLKAMAKRVNDRFTTAADLFEELTKLLGALPSDPGPEAEPVQNAGALARLDAADASDKTPASQRRREAERRQVTMLACGCDLFESAEFIEALDYEEQHEIKRVYQQVCAEAVKRFGGAILQMTGRETLGCFGYPVAHEDAAARAVRAGLVLLKDIGPLRERLGSRGLALALTVRVHTGVAVVSETSPSPGGETFSVAGEAYNVISRLDALARPDIVAISQSTYRLVQEAFRCETLGSVALKGIARPLEFFRVLREHEARSRFEGASPTGLSPLVGRDREVGLLQDRWEQAVEGMGQIVSIIGEAGLGKSRLLHVVKEYVEVQSTGGERPIVEWRCTPQHQNSSFYPVIDYCERRMGFEREEPPPVKFEKMRQHLGRLGLDTDEIVPYVAALLSLPLGDHFTPIAVGPARQKERTLEILLEWIRVYASRQPFLFIIEDLHWIDPSTLELLARHVESPSERILTLLTFRPEFETPWKNKAHQTVMALNRLTKKQVSDMIRQKTGLRAPPVNWVEQIAAKTDGVPLFVEEYTMMMMEADKLQEAAGSVAVSSSFLSQPIPATLQDLLMARLDRMASNREVVQIAAALGREFSYELIRAVWSEDEATLQAELGKLVTAELLYQRGKPPHAGYLFKHALIQDAAYQSQLKSKRQLVHRRIAAALEAKFADVVAHQPELLAHHFTEAGQVPEGIAYWTKAGLRAQDKLANLEAACHLRRGLELLAGLPDTLERAAQELSLQIPLGTVLIAAYGYASPEVGPAFTRARELSLKIADPPTLLAVLWGVWAWRLVREELDLCKPLAVEVMNLADSQTDPGIVMEALFVPGQTAFYTGDLVRARELFARAITLYDAGRCAAWSRHTGQNSGVTARCYLALAQWYLGYPDQALRTARDAVALADEVKHPFSQCFAHHHLGWLQQHLRLGKEAQASAEAELAIAAEQGFTFWKAVGTLCRSAGLLLQNQSAAALTEAQHGLEIFRSTGAGLSIGHYLGYIAEAQWQLGRHADALRSIDEALAANARNHNDFCTPELYRVKGEILLSQGPHQEMGAEACFQDSLAVAAKQQARSWELRTTMSLCRLWHKQGRHAEARDLLATVFGCFTEGFETPDLQDAMKLLGA